MTFRLWDPDGPGGRHLELSALTRRAGPRRTTHGPLFRRNFRGRLPGAAGQLGAVDELRTMPFTDAPHCPLAPFWAIHAALELAALGRAQAAAAFVTVLRLMFTLSSLQPPAFNVEFHFEVLGR